MSPWLTLRVRFPQGSYDAVGTKGRHEWPPAPERLTAAGLAGQAGMSSRPVDVLYELDAPVISAPAVGRARNHHYSRWVPRQSAGVNPKGEDKYGSKVDKAPGDNAGVLVDPASQVVYAWDVDGVDIDEAGLREAFARVAYLGRPTSPVIVEVLCTDELDLPVDQPVYRPDPRGKVSMSVPAPQVLASRERAWAIRLAAGAHDVRAPQVMRSWQSYSTSTGNEHMLLADRRRLGLRTAGWRWFWCPRNTPADAVHVVMGALRAEGGQDVLPGFLDDELVLVGARDVDDLDGFEAVYGRRILRLRYNAARPPRVLDALVPLVSTSAVWTTTLPTVPGDLRDDLQSITDQAQVAEAFTHDEPKGRSRLWPRPMPGSTNITVWFDRPVSGPLFVGGTAMQALDVNVEDPEEDQ